MCIAFIINETTCNYFEYSRKLTNKFNNVINVVVIIMLKELNVYVNKPLNHLPHVEKLVHGKEFETNTNLYSIIKFN